MPARSSSRLVLTALVAVAAIAPFCATLPAHATGSPAVPPIRMITPHPLPPADALPPKPGSDDLPAPGALHYTANVALCKEQVTTDLDCSLLGTRGALAFYATWECPGICAVSGFKLRYAVKRSARRAAPAKSDALDVAKSRPVFIELPPAGGWKGQCFAVSAFRSPSTIVTGAYAESPPSPQVCIGNISGSP
jgi:hypothetical protein